MNRPPTSPQLYWKVWAGLLFLLLLTWLAAKIDLGPLNAVAALTIAIAKTVLVILYFMHVRDSKRLTWVFASAGFLWLAILFALTLSDYLTRNV